jgi:predicted esterase
VSYPVTEAITDAVYAKALQPDAAPSEWKLDVYAPAQPGPWPVVVFAHGVGSRKSSYAPLSRDIAGQGAVVFTIDWPTRYPTYAVKDNGKGLREVLETLTCAVRFARARAPDFGGDPGHVILVGYSLGGIGAQVALVGDEVDRLWEEFAALRGGPPPQIDCAAGEVSAHVDAFVGVAGVYMGYEGKYGREWLQAEDPELWELFFSSLEQNPDLEVRLIHGDDDHDVPINGAAEFAAALALAGYDAKLFPFSGGHTVPFELTVQTVLEVAGK